MKKLLLSYSLMLCLMTAFAQKNHSFWSKTSKENSFKKELKLRKTNPKKAQYYNLNIDALKNHLTDAPQRKSPVNNSQKLVDFPTANDSFETFSVMEASVLEKPLQDKYPNIKTYVGKSISNPSNTIRFSITPQGLHTMSFKPGSGTEFIDPYTKDSEAYIVYSKKDLPVLDAPWICEFEDDTATNTKQRNVANTSYFNANDGMMRDFRLALACTVEYAQFQWSRAGLKANDTETDKKAAVLAAMVVTINRNNFIYERDLSVTMTIVANNESVIFIDSDDFSNSSAFALINESQTVIDAIIGPLNYDIGHTFSKGGGGIAALSSACTTFKARGITGSLTPVGDAYDVDYVAHEIGHQFGAPHTFNGNSGNCVGVNRSASSAYEPGSGSTIMAYAGLCTPQNIQNNSDAYFHQNSLQMMWDNIANGNSSCAKQTATENAAPTSNAGKNYIIPAATPYKLTGTSTDTDGIITHTYTWEQYDLGATGLPLESNTSGPLVRSYEGTNNTSRYIPRMADILVNGGVSTAWEKLASVDRDLNFKLTVRDNDTNGGQTATDQMTAKVVSAAGPFAVTSQSVNDQALVAGATETITWNVAGTAANGIDEANVDILLSTDGLNYDTVLVANVPNDGSHDITVPNIPSNSCRIMVAASDNIFFNINAKNITITATLAPVIILTGANPQRIELGTAYSELNAIATDDKDGDISASIVIDASAVNVNTVGDYTVTYNVSDAVGNAATQVTRKVTITADATIPEITLTGASPQRIAFGTAYSELGATATDNIDEDITASIVIDASAVNVNTVGDYTVTYNVSDAAGNAATQVTRTVNVVDATIPEITLTGASPQRIAFGTAYSELGATATDNIDGDISASIVIDASAVNVNTVGDYTVTYNVSDAAGNAATQVTRTVNVVDATIPVLTLVGANPQRIAFGTAYSELGATATDNIDGDISASIVIDASAVNVNIVGDYTVTYNVSDAAGNNAVEVTRTVTITIAGDTFATATTLPFTISAEGTGCATSNIAIDFPNSGFTASGLLGNGTPGNEGVDAFFNWTATTEALRYWGAGVGNPYIVIHDASGTEIAGSYYQEANLVLSGWAVGDELVIRIYDFGEAMVLVDFCLEYYTLPAVPNCAENVSPTGSDMSFNNGVVSLSWDAPSSGPVPTAYEVYWGTTSGFSWGRTSGNLSSRVVIDAPATTATITGVFYGETYYYSVVPRNGVSLAMGCAEYSLTIENTSVPFNTDFSNYPAGFSESTEPFGTPSTTDNNSRWKTSDFLNDATLGKGAKVNIFLLRNEYLISPTFDLSSGTHYLNIDAGITAYNDTGAPENGMDADDDYVAVLLSEDDGATWAELHRWDSTSGLTEVSQAMPEVTLSTVSTTAKIALYAFSGVSEGDYDFHVTNFQVTAAADVTVPAITLIGANPQRIELGTAYSELGATATDNIDGDITGSIVIDATAVNVNTVGDYTVTYNVSDAATNDAVEVTRTVTITADATIPVLTLVGANPQRIELGTAYSELGAAATDNIDGDITGSIVIDATAVNVNIVGDYTVTYNVSDAATNDAVEVTRTVTITADVTVPVITLTGADVSQEVGGSYSDAGATASDNIDGTITDNIAVSGQTVDPNTVGAYIITYNVSDAAGNPAVEVTRTVTITADVTVPVITLTGADVSQEVGGSYSDAGATASDNIDGTITDNIAVSGQTVDPNTVGAYIITYNVSDVAGNPAVEVTRTVTITADVTVPVITLTGADVSQEVGGSYSDAGATASDNIDGTITDNIAVSGQTVDPNTVGAYIITYNVSDVAGNPAVEVTRTVTITADVTVPVITLTGADVSQEVGGSYSDAGATASDNIDGTITDNIAVSGQTVDPNTVGAYIITYNVSDVAGNPAVEVTRTVTITADVTVPVITLTGADVSQEVGGSYSDAGATASDNIDGTITDNIAVSGQIVDPNTVGVYTVTYNVQDAAGNNAVEVTRTVTITADATIPVITLVGANPQSIELGTAYSELGATATDNIDGDITANISIDASAVNVNTVGDYTVTYNVSDANGSAAEEVTRTVIIESSLSTEDNTKNIVKIYPNPVKDKLFIQGLLKPTKISVYNVLGKLVLSKITLNEINVNNLQSGIYVIKVKEEQKEILLKFIKN